MHHIVDVISVAEPQVRLLKAGQPRVVPAARMTRRRAVAELHVRKVSLRMLRQLP